MRDTTSKKKKRGEDEDISPHTDEQRDKGETMKKKKKHKKVKKDKKRKRQETEDGSVPAKNEPMIEDEPMKARANESSEDDDNDAKQTKDFKTEMSSKEKRQKRKEEKRRLMEIVPLKDDHGISYTKQQLRRMRKRVARGLPPIESEQEKRERLRQDALLRKQEEAELQGIVYQKDGTTKNEDDSDQEEDSDEETDRNENEMDKPVDAGQPTTEKKQSTTSSDMNRDASEKTEQGESPRKQAKRNKDVPADYVCQACKNKETPPLHWIYDCPLKITMRGINHKKSTKHVHDPSSLKVFVSGLPFDAKVKDVRQLFLACGTMKKCKLLTFPDTERCKGQAYLTFETAEAALEALKLNGSPIGGDNDEEGEGKKRKGLTLKVSKMLSRAATRKKSSRPPNRK